MTPTVVKDSETEKIVPIDIRNIFTLYYRKGQNPYPMAKHFVQKTGGLPKAIDAGRDHCDRITARFIRVVSFISNLNEEEAKYLEGE